MKFKVYKNEKQLRNEEFYFNDQKIILIFHGLFGRAKNWHSIALRISSIFDVWDSVIVLVIYISAPCFALLIFLNASSRGQLLGDKRPIASVSVF